MITVLPLEKNKQNIVYKKTIIVLFWFALFSKASIIIYIKVKLT